MKSFRKRIFRTSFISHGIALALGMGVIVLLTQQRTPCAQVYDLLNPQIRCEGALQQGEWDYEPLREALILKKNELKNSGALSHLSVYFRDLDRGARFGVGEYDKFQPASLRKVPVLIAYLHMADLEPSILEKTLSYTGDLRIGINVEKSEETIKPDTQYTIRELLTKMIVYSDNYSYMLLNDEMNANPPIIPYYTFRDLDVLRMMMDPKGEYVSIQTYGNLFAVLYNTGYLSRKMSQYALDLLSQATFKDGIVAGVPAEVRVAHKFGERADLEQDKQLHDCGIVYHPELSYVLCIMTTGVNLERQKVAIADVSRMVYDTVSSLHFGNRKNSASAE